MVRWAACVKRWHPNDSLGVRLRSHRTNASRATREGRHPAATWPVTRWVSRERGVISHQIPFPGGGIGDRTEASPRPLGSTTRGNGT